MSLLATIAKTILPTALVHRLRAARRSSLSSGEFRRWTKSAYSSPSPSKVKRAVIVRHNLSDSTWVETGTYHGDTTAILGQIAKMVYSIEPERTLAAMATSRFHGVQNIKIVNDTSERAFSSIINNIDGNLCLWLDGHYSAGGTFLGEKVSPIEEELAGIEKNLDRLGDVTILVDDFRLFCSDPDYPDPSCLTQWAERNNMRWTVEHDIFVARKS